jgi:hypothetical protein
MPIQVIPEYDRLQVVPIGATEAQVAKIGSIFAATWGRIRPEDQSRIRSYWDHELPLPPGIVLRSKILYTYPGQGPAWVFPRAEGIEFDADRLCDFPSEVWIGLVIAEELAHVFLYATKHPSHMAQQPADVAARGAWYEAREAEARRVLGEWGFDLAEHERAFKWELSTRGTNAPEKPA